jgi:hypothetical protein
VKAFLSSYIIFEKGKTRKRTHRRHVAANKIKNELNYI